MKQKLKQILLAALVIIFTIFAVGIVGNSDADEYIEATHTRKCTSLRACLRKD